MKFSAARARMASAGTMAAILIGCLAAGGCDMEFDKSASRHEQMVEEAGKLSKILQQVTDEASARAHLDEIQVIGDRLRELQGASIDAQSKSETNVSMITSNRQARLFRQVALGVVRNSDRIREADPQAGELIDKALEGIYWN